MDTKTCSRCSETKDVAEFYCSEQSADKLRCECKVCCKAAANKWRDENPEKVRASCKRYYEENTKKCIEGSRRWSRDNPDKVAASRKAYRARTYKPHPRQKMSDKEKKAKKKAYAARVYEENKDEINASTNAWNRANPESMRKSRKRYNKTHPEARKAEKHRRRTRIAGNGGSYTADEWQALVEHCGGFCQCCGEETELTVDHIIPVVKGGTSNIDNLQPLCLPCNSSKGTKIFNFLERV